MANIVYEEEPVKEEIFSGTLVLDSSLSLEDQRRKIIQMMETAGVEVKNDAELEISYDDSKTDSEPKTTAFHVFQNTIKKTPYRISREEIFKGSIILDPIPLSPEAQQEKVFQMMRTAGVEVGDPTTLEIGYEGADTNEGYSESQSSDFTVFRIHKEEVKDGLISNEVKEELDASLKEIKELRSKLETIVNSEERKALIDELFEKTDALEKSIGKYTGMDDVLIQELDEIDNQIMLLQQSLKKAAQRFEESFHRMEKIVEEQTRAFENGTLSEEALDSLRVTFTRRKTEENEKSVRIRKEIEEQKRRLTALKRKRNKIERDLGRAVDLGVPVTDLQDIDAMLKKTNIINAILDQKGLDEVVDKKASERTNEEKKKLKKAKEEIVHEISEAQKKDKKLSVLDAIEALYSLQVQYKQGRPPRVLLVKASQLEQIKKNVDKVPERIVGDAKVYNYHPEETPEDMAEATASYQREEVFSGTYILDGERMSVEQQRKKIFDMMRIAGIEIEDENDYEIGYEGVEDDQGISETQSTKFVVYRKIKEEKKEESKEVEAEKEEPIKVLSAAEDIAQEGVSERIVFFKDINNNGDIYVRDYVTKRFTAIPTSKEVPIEESICFRIDPEDAEFIFNNQNNSYSPYFVEVREISLPKEEALVPIEVEEKPKDKILVFEDLDHNHDKYVSQPTIVRFNLVPLSDAVSIEGESVYRISDEDYSFVENNQTNQYAPYEIESTEVRLGKKEEPVTREVVEEDRRGDIVEKITIYRDLDNNNEVYVKKYVKDRFNLIPTSGEERIDGAVCFRIENEDAGYLITNANNRYSPYEVEVIDVELGKRVVVDDLVTVLERKDMVGKIELYRNTDNNNDIYVKKNTIDRFHLQPMGHEVHIEKAACYHISEDDANFIIGNAHNKYAPYEIELIDVSLGKAEDLEQEAKPNEGLLEKIVIYRRLGEDNQVFVKRYTLHRFNLEEKKDTVIIDGVECYPISEEDALYIMNNQNNGYSPYQLEFRNIQAKEQEPEEIVPEPLEEELTEESMHSEEPEEEERVILEDESEKETIEEEVAVEDSSEPEPVVESEPEPELEEEPESEVEPEAEAESESEPEVEPEVKPKDEEEEEIIPEEIVVYRNPENPKEFYVDRDALTRFAITPIGPAIVMEDRQYYPIREEDKKRIHDFIVYMKESVYIRYKNIPVAPKKEEPKKETKELSYEAIMEKLKLPGPVIGATRYTPTNIKMTKIFRKELKEGTWAYNIVHLLSSIRLISARFLQKLSSKLFGTKFGEDSMEAFQKRVDALTDEELEILLHEYKDSRLEHKANQVIVERLRKYLLEKISKYEVTIAEEYESMYQLLGQIRVLEESLMDEGLDRDHKDAYIEGRRQKLIQAAAIMKKMVEQRKQVQELLGEHFIEDIPEAKERYPFATMQYKKELPREYQERYHEYEVAYQHAVEEDNAERIVDAAMGMESCYFESSDVAIRMAGAKSVGMKYYTPIVNEFHFKDDAFIRDLFCTIATSSAMIQYIDVVRIRNVEESADLDESGRFKATIDDPDYGKEHAVTAAEVVDPFNQLLVSYGSNDYTQDTCLAELTQIRRDAVRRLDGVTKEIVSFAEYYREAHPEYMADKVEQDAVYVVEHPESVASLGGRRDVIAESLYGLPKNLLTSLIYGASHCLLAANISQEMSKKYTSLRTADLDAMFMQMNDTGERDTSMHL